MISELRTLVSGFPLLIDLPRARAISDVEATVRFVTGHRFIRPGQVREEFEQFAQLVANVRPKYVLEIGTLRGGTLFTLCRLADPEATLISLDLPNGSFGGGYRWFQAPIFRSFAQPCQSMHLIRGNSHDGDSKIQVQAILGGVPLDLLFIDGDHTYDGVKQDFEMYAPLVRAGGLIIFHDIVEHSTDKNCQVDCFWRELKPLYQSREIIGNPNQGWAGIGVLWK